MQFINLHTHQFTNDSSILEIVNQYPWEFDETIPAYSIGIHPWYIDENRLESDLKLIDEKLKLKECLALGECGLDKRIEIPLEIQKEVFIKQILIAEKHQKPLILHCVAAFQEVIQIKKQLGIKVPIIIHGFSKQGKLAKQLVDNGFYISFGKYLMQNEELKSVFNAIPNDRFFLETDTIKESLKEVYQLAADYKHMKLTEIVETVKNNFNTTFKINIQDL